MIFIWSNLSFLPLNNHPSSIGLVDSSLAAAKPCIAFVVVDPVGFARMNPKLEADLRRSRMEWPVAGRGDNDWPNRDGNNVTGHPGESSL
jgi:hypothetical protein